MQAVTLQPGHYYHQRLVQQQIGLSDSQGQFTALPVSLSPWHLSPALWQQAQHYSQLLSRLLLAASCDGHWLKAQFAGLTSANLLTALASQPAAFNQTCAPLPIIRHDFLLDRQLQWRWVESNTIAAGMGPLNQQLVQLLSTEFTALAENPAIAQQSAALYQAALELRRQYQGNTPLIVFVVEPQEDNIFDQLLLQQALQQFGARVLRLTLSELTQARVNRQNRLQLADAGEVDVLYYRTGYNLLDYSSSAELTLRAALQQVAVVQCPDLPLQLAGSKWVQASLSRLLLSDVALPLRRWGLSNSEIAQLRQLVMPVFPLNQLAPAKAQRYIEQGWILKSQQEGGGSVWRGADARQQLQSDDDSLVLMAPVDSYIRPEPVRLLRQNTVQYQHGTVSELGIFTVGNAHHYGGYLLRSKDATQLAGGVHRGAAVLDSVILK